MQKIKILNIGIDNVSSLELLRSLKQGVLVTPNIDHLVKLQKNKELYNLYSKAEWIVCDSKVIYLFSRLLQCSLRDVIPGSSFFPKFYMYHKDDMDCRIFLLGAMEGVAVKAMENINQKVGRKIVVGAYSPSYGFEKEQNENEEIYKMINESGANVVLVGVGCPKQEKWIFTHKDKMIMSKKLIAVCACPMGLAHTFMAAQALEEAAVEAGYEVKIETQGADGIQNRLTAQDIAEATLIIHSVAVTPEDNERFESRDVYEITLQDAIKNAAGIIKEIEEMVAAEQQ